MPDNPRIEDLRRRIQKDPASIAFAQLAEELRRAGQSQEAVDICNSGLASHPGYLSARVTLGRALLELGQLAEAQEELEHVLASAPENLAAIRGLADIHHSKGAHVEALKYYRAALVLARNDPDLQRTVDDLSATIEGKPEIAPDGLSFEQIQDEFLKLTPPPAQSLEQPTEQAVEQASAAEQAPTVDMIPDPTSAHALETVAALEQYLDAIHVARAQRRA